ncbi:MAG: hypothetical protein N2112_12885 [Gemmataceae bacterium]|nr:hypothetical protein [Gemmataceae bacterium]
MNFVASILVCISLGYQELNWYSPYYQLSIADAYDFQISFEAAKGQHAHAKKLLNLLKYHRASTEKEMTQEQSEKLDIVIAWQLQRERIWYHLKDALDPSRNFSNRRESLYYVRDYLIVYGAGVVPYWSTKKIPPPVFGD